MKKYTIEFSNKYDYLTPKPAEVMSDSPAGALSVFLNSKGLFNDVEVTDYSGSDARVVETSNGDSFFYRILEKETITKNHPNAIEQKDISEVQKLLKQNPLKLYHGTKNSGLKPDFQFNNVNNDYGKGFYTTPYPELGKEWAYASYTQGDKGYLYEYSLDLIDMDILDLTRMDSVHWIAELITNRNLNTENREALKDTIERFKKKYKLNTDAKDVIIGYRADDSYFRYATDFLSGTIYKDTLESALRNGNLGIQVFIKSEKAFKALKQVGAPAEVPIEYKGHYEKRDRNARKQYQKDRSNQASRTKILVFDLLN